MITTTTARGGMTVLAKEYKGTAYPKTFTNRAQANAAVAKLAAQGIDAYVTAMWPFLVVITSKAAV